MCHDLFFMWSGTTKKETVISFAYNTTHSRKHQGTYLSRLIGQQCALRCLFPLSAGLKLREVSVIVPLHLQVENSGFPCGGGRNKMSIKNLQNTVTDSAQLLFHLGPVVFDDRDVFLVALALLLLFNGGNNPPRGPPRSNHVLVRHRQQVPLLHCKLSDVHSLGHLFHGLYHLIIPLRLLRKLRYVNILFSGFRRHISHLLSPPWNKNKTIKNQNLFNQKKRKKEKKEEHTDNKKPFADQNN